jgi:beta-lactamase regulating signal transducer with metallopeptidase domain
MFAARGLAVSFSVFVMVYCALSLAVCFTWRRVRIYGQKHPVRRIADLLFALRMFPLLTAALITAAFTVPSFLLLEPRAIDEPIGEVPLVLGLCGALLGIFGLVNAALALRRASRTISTWTADAQPLQSCASVPVLRMARKFPPMTAAGIVRPRVLLSSAAEFVLNGNELQTALNHEVAHVRRRDNLKKLLLRFVAFPGMSGLEEAWLEATEMAADDAAVANAGDALDLAAALIKLSRLGATEPPADLTAALVHSRASVMNARVERLVGWSEERLVPSRKNSLSCELAYGVSAALATIAIFAVTYSHLLMHVHTATEWLVR